MFFICRLFLVGTLKASPSMAQELPIETLQARSRLVQMNVVVRDARDRPVKDLVQRDFSVFDEHRPVRIESVELIDHDAEVTSSRVSHASRSLVLSNRSSANADNISSATVVLLDSLNMQSTDDLLYAKGELLRCLGEMSSDNRVAIYALSGPTITIVHDFGNSVESLRSLAGGGGFVGKWLRASKTDEEELTPQRIRAEWTLGALESIALHVANIPGRKTLIWISSGFPINPGFIHMESLLQGALNAGGRKGDIDSYYSRLKQLARTLSNVDVAVYPVDPRGLAVDDQYQLTTRSANAGRLITKNEDNAGEFQTMDLIASETGGRAFYNANALSESIRMSFDDARVAYSIWFYPDDESWNGKSHNLEVKVDRSNVVMRYRRSYFASDTHVESVLDRDAALQTAASSSLIATAIGLTVKAQSNPLHPGRQHIEFSPEPTDIYFEKSGGKLRCDFDLVIIQQSADGSRLSGEKNRCVVDRETYSDAKKKSILLVRDITVDKDASLIRIVVRDSLTGAVGSLEIPVKP